ncbi:MAG: SRPBCC family protein [Phyllobacterium sp.]
MTEALYHEEPGRMIAPRTVRLERLLPGSIERAWSYLTDSEKRGQWLASGPMDLRKGGKVELTFRNSELSDEAAPERYAIYEGRCNHGEITEIDPPHRISMTWPHGSDHSEVTFELTRKGNDTLLVVTHKNLPDRGEMVGVASGWDAHLGVLIDRLNGREPKGFWTNILKRQKQYQEIFPAE